MNTYKRLALVALLLIFSLSVYAQHRGIWGRVTSVNTGSEGIMVLLLNSGDSSVIRTAATDSSGDYYMDAPPPGKYFVMATGMGYEHYYGQVFNFDGSNYHYPDIDLQNARELNEVSVTYNKPMIERKADRIIINTGKMISASGSSVFDMLKKLPGIRITSDDAISMNNKDGILVLIDNRNTNLAMADIISLMKSLPASEIDKVELIFNPPARYDAAGNAGIINLVTKKGVKDGFNGTLTAAYLQGIYPKGNASMSFNLRKKKWNIFGSLPLQYYEGNSEQGMNIRISSDTGLVFSTRGNSDMKQRYMTGGVKLGADYYVSKNTIVGAMVHTNLLDADVRTSNTNQLWTSNISNILHTHTDFNMGRFFISNNLNYKQTLAGIGTLSADVDYIYYHSDFSQTINTKFYDNNLNEINNPLSIKSNSPVVSKITAGKIDFVHPGKRGCKTEAGLKFSYVTSDNSVLYKRLQNNEWVGDNRSNNFIYSENINAGYITQSAIQEKWELQAGVRIEHTHGEGKQVNGNNQFTRDFVDIFPSGLISYKPSEINSFGLTYGRRIERPKYESLNPFLIFLDTLSAEQGNPSLLPQYSNNVALSYTYRQTFLFSLEYGITNHAFSKIALQNPGERSITFKEDNIDKRETLNFSVSLSYQLARWWFAYFVASAGYTAYKGSVHNYPVSVENFSPNATFSNTLQWGKGWTFEASGQYYGNSLEYTLAVAKPLLQLNGGISKTFLNNTGKLQLLVSDVLWQYYRSEAVYGNYVNSHRYRADNRTVGLVFSWLFGKKSIEKARSRQTGINDEKARLKN